MNLCSDRKVINTVMRYLHNYFVQDFFEGRFKISQYTTTSSSGKLSRRGEYSSLTSKCWVAIVGSKQHDGVWKLDMSGCLVGMDSTFTYDDEFDGKVYELSLPVGFLEMCYDIGQYMADHPVVAADSVRIGQYSESGTKSWMEAYGGLLEQWRKNPLECEIRV